MRYLSVAIVFVLFSACTPAASQNSSVPIQDAFPHPTEAEWLEVFITHRIAQSTDVWGRRVGIRTMVTQDKSIIVTMTLANGEEPITSSAEKSYEETASVIIQSILEEYGLQGLYSVTVQFV